MATSVTGATSRLAPPRDDPGTIQGGSVSDEFTTSRGVTVRFVGIATLIDKINSQFNLPEPPYYEVKTATGGVEKHLHDETTVQTDAEREALKTYQSEVNRIQSEHSYKLTRLCLMRGTVFDYPSNDEWVREQEFLGIDVPDDPTERKWHYIETEVVATTQDVEQIILGVMRASGVDEEKVSQIEALFRHPVQRDEARRPDDGNGSDVALRDAVRAGARGVEDAQVPKRVRRRHAGG